MRKIHKRNYLKLSILAAVVGALPLSAWAAGLGKLTVLSALGQPLRAELEVAASREEVTSLTARVASVETFRQANIDYATILPGLRFSLEKHPGGQAYFKITTDRPVNDPFLDFLVELNWSSGRLVREYTFLLDPPDSRQAEQSAPVAAALPEAPPVTRPEQPEAMGMEPAIPPAAKSGRVSAAAAPMAAAGSGEQRMVKRGDTLGRIAADLQPSAVSLDQMLVAMFKANPGAFDGNNMNRLRAGKVLTVPDADAIAALGAAEAHVIVVAHAADFDAYRKRLASAAAASSPVAEQASQRQSGKLAAKVAEPETSSGNSDKLQVSRTESTRMPGASGKQKAAEEDVVVREKALKDANSRIADLEKNLADLKKLAELKNAAAAKVADKASSSNGPEIKAEPPISVPPKAAERAMPPAKPTPHKAPPPPPPSFIEENGTLLVGGGGGLLALLGGYFGFSAWKRKRAADSENSIGLSEPSLAENSIFSVAQHVDTASAPVGGDLAAGEAVDPLQEAEVYLAYGRDSQAEEILLDALKATPTRLAIHSKLLEIYAARKSVPQFVTLAEDLHQQTGGTGPEWEMAAALGCVIDPTNPLFGGASREIEAQVAPAAVTTEPAAAVEPVPAVAGGMAERAIAEEAMAEVPDTLDFDLDLGAPAVAASIGQSEVVPVQADSEAITLDFDLDLDSPAATAEPATVAQTSAEADSSNSLDIDFDLPGFGSAPTASEASVALETETGNTVDFDLGDISAEPASAGAALPDAEGLADKPLDLDFDLGEPVALPESEPMAAPLDLSSISLDLDASPVGAETGSAIIEDNPDVATKLELAQAYQEMGDKEGARELLQEVLREGSPAQQEAARGKLVELG